MLHAGFPHLCQVAIVGHPLRMRMRRDVIFRSPR
jgi:hypothetical protein